VLFEMLTGHPAFEADSATEVVANVLTQQPGWNRLPRETPQPIEHLIRRCLEKDARQRLRDMGDARLELDEAERLRTATIRPRTVARIFDRRRALLTSTAALLALAIGLGAWWWSSKSREASHAARRPPTGGAGARNLTRITFSPGLQTGATWSPEGQAVAFASDHAGNFDIWVQPVSGGDARQLTWSPAADTEPAWSPDGRSIVFRSEREGGGLFVVPASGGPERQLTSFGVKPQWTPDGTEILFRSSAFSTTSATGFDETSGLYAVAAAGGDSPHQILQLFLNGGRWGWIASRPNGQISALGQHPTLGWGFFTVSRDGRHVTRSELAADLPLRLGNSQMSQAGTRVVRFQWNAAGTALYVEAIVNEVQSIWRVDVEQNTLRWISAERLTTGSGADANVAISRDDRRLVFTTEQHASRLWAFPFDASGGGIVGHGIPVTPEQDVITWSALAPDGSKVAYVIKRAGSRQSDLWAVNIDGSQRELLAQNALGGQWAPNGKAIAYSLFRIESGEWALATRTIGGPERLLSPWSRDSAFLTNDWTRDGSAILGSYMSPISAPAVLALWPAGKPASKPLRVSLAVSNASLWQARFSPDMHWIALVVQRHGSSEGVELSVVRAADGEAAELTRIATDHLWPDKPKWAPDGRTLYFLSRRHAADPFDLWGTRFDSNRGVVGTPFRVTHFDSPNQMISPDVANTDMGIAQRWALLTIETVTGNIWMLDNVDQ
jgi:Tol biopolymer transport system component